jgi:hypothetical protein
MADFEMMIPRCVGLTKLALWINERRELGMSEAFVAFLSELLVKRPQRVKRDMSLL